MIKYRYNAEGIREMKLGEREVRYLLDGLAVLCEYEEGIKREYVEGVSMKEDNQKYYYIYDRLGNVRYVLDENGAVVKSYSYSPFGQIDSSSGSLSNPYQFVGGEFYYKEEDMGLYLLGHRWYDAEVGRFISRDPIGEEGGLNLYVYVRNNPVNMIDSVGKKTVEECHKEWQRCVEEAREELIRCGVHCFGMTLGTEIECVILCGFIPDPITRNICYLGCTGVLSMITIRCVGICLEQYQKVVEKCNEIYERCLKCAE